MSAWTKSTSEQYVLTYREQTDNAMRFDDLTSAVRWIDGGVRAGNDLADYTIERQRVLTIISDPEPVQLPDELIVTARAIEADRAQAMQRRDELAR